MEQSLNNPKPLKQLINKDLMSRYSFKDFDKYNCLTLSFSYYAILLFLLKGYAIGIVSLSNFKDKLTVIQWFYPESELFYLSLLTGVPGLFLMYIIFQRKPGASQFIKSIWNHIGYVCTALVLIDFMIYWSLFYFKQIGQFNWLLGQTCFGILATVYCLKSVRAMINRHEFPEAIPEPKKRTKRRGVV